jgi:GTP pyrophosphokinase
MTAKAIQFATECHKGQLRRTGDEYLVHPLSVMKQVAKLGFDEETQVAAVLHDVYEATDISLQDIERQFGGKVAKMVFLLSKEDKTKFSDDIFGFNDRLGVYLEQLKLGASELPEILFIKICDQLDNLKTLSVFREQKYYRTLWVLQLLYVPLYRKCMANMPSDLEAKFAPLFEEFMNVINCYLSKTHQEVYIEDKALECVL